MGRKTFGGHGGVWGGMAGMGGYAAVGRLRASHRGVWGGGPEIASHSQSLSSTRITDPKPSQLLNLDPPRLRPEAQ